MNRFLALSFLTGIIFSTSIPAWAQDGKNMNNYWDTLDKRFPNLNKPWQQPGEIEKAGDIKAPQGKWGPLPREEDIPKGEKAVTRKTSEGCKQRVVLCSDTLFNYDDSTLRPSAEAALKIAGPKLLEFAQRHPITIEGYTDSMGPDDYNQGLSERRAMQVKNWLLSNHFIPPDAEIKGYGEKQPVAENTTKDGKDNPQGRALNRRVEIVVDTCKTTADTTGGSTWSMTMGETKETVSEEEAAKNAKFLPSNDLYTSAEIDKSFNLIKVNPLENPDLHFEVLIPTEWRSGSISVSRDQIAKDDKNQIPLVQLSPSTGDDVSTEVRYQRLPAAVTPEEFLKVYAQAANMQIMARQHATFNGKPAEDALLMTHSALNGNMFTRLTVTRRGDYIFMLASSSPEDEYPKWKRIFGAAAVSFDPKGNAPGAPTTATETK